MPHCLQCPVPGCAYSVGFPDKPNKQQQNKLLDEFIAHIHTHRKAELVTATLSYAVHEFKHELGHLFPLLKEIEDHE